ncbi:unnamed protein product [Rhizoctonia solani]|uniref:N-acetyltransferase domain-containing protein n=1 Tax=Rhizoctonia solani TaxID=456999 RepID=A0A8H3GSH7_9AGAM|nr:unnamed protein product [Rhizoctonia solani]
MNTCIPKPSGLEIQFLEAQGGRIKNELFHELTALLEESRALDYMSPLPAIPDCLGKFDEMYIILREGFKRTVGDNGAILYSYLPFAGGHAHWLAGFACLLFPPRRQWGASAALGSEVLGDTAEIRIALGSAAQKQGYGRYIIQQLVGHAFNTLGIRRVTASIVCPTRPSHSATVQKQVLYNTKQLCWIFEKFGFKFEGISRGAVMSRVSEEEPVWHNVHRISMLHTDYLGAGRSYVLSNTYSFHEEIPPRLGLRSPWVTMIERHEEERQDVKSWDVEAQAASAGDACDEDGETVLGSDSDQDWDMASDFDD